MRTPKRKLRADAKGTVMGTATAAGRAELLARFDRIPVWPFPKTVLVVVGAGFFFSFFDILTIAFALPVIMTEFKVTADAATWAVTASLIGYIVGSFLDSRIADRHGRRVALFLSVAFFSVGSILAATSQDLTWLIVWRFISGMGIGAEIALVTTYMSELSPAKVRGRCTGWAIVCGFVGFAAVPLIAFKLVPDYDWGWRALFVLGGVGGLLIGVMRRSLPRSPRWLLEHGGEDEARAIVEGAEERARGLLGGALPPAPLGPTLGDARLEHTDKGSLRHVFRPPYLGRVILLMSVWFLYYVGNYAWLTLAPELLQDAGFALEQDYFTLSVTGIGFVAGGMAAVYFSDRGERKTLCALVAFAWTACLLVIGWFPSETVIMVMGFLAAGTIGLLVPVLYTYTGENFPTHVRATGVSVSDGIGHLGGAFCGQIILGIDKTWGFKGAFVGMALTGLLAGILLLFGPRSTGRRLDETAPA